MAVTDIAQQGLGAEIDVVLYRFDTETFDRLLRTGALDEVRVELIDGLLVEMTAPTPEHDGIIERLTAYLAQTHGRGPRVQLSLGVVDGTVLLPDLTLVDGPISLRTRPSTARLAIEVAVSSHRLDRGRKAQLYAAAGVEAYWLVDVPGVAVEVRTEPGPAGYAKTTVYRRGDVVPSPADGVPDLPVDALLAGLP